jgi:hypothetical protein
VRQLAAEPRVFVLAAEHPLASRTALELGDTAALPWITAATAADGCDPTAWRDDWLMSPRPIVWWFSGGLIGDMDIDGRAVSRYRVWHPYDHVQARALVNRPAEAREGATAELEEYFGRNPEYYTNPAVRVDQIDDEVVTTTWFENGIAIGHLDHELEAVPGGMRLGHVMYVPGESTELGKLLAPRVWPRAMGEAWIKHGIQEMGNFENFLPQLYEREADRQTE